MPGTTQSCTDGCSATSIVLDREHEAGFLLPQFMGALASETMGLTLTNRCQQPTGPGVFARLGASLMQSLKLRLLFGK
ncbi:MULTISPECIES: hypothetical protein [unclassified Pseudomonas]|uniref:hypothetical protein n=1 Tax=Pseudomonas sp. Ant30-3 TaxID=1488328 RepID=UPI00048D2D93|nr:hypothetical protein [Pseudomonas sp. Ant30-3]